MSDTVQVEEYVPARAFAGTGRVQVGVTWLFFVGWPALRRCRRRPQE